MDWFWGGGFFLGQLILLTIAELIRKKLEGKAEFTRKIVHIITGLFIVVTPYFFESNRPLLVITLIFIPIIYLAIRWNLFQSLHATERKSYGTVFYPLAFLILNYFLWEHFKVVLVSSILILAIADVFAALVGTRIQNPKKYKLGGESKSIQGSLAMFGMTGAIVFFSTYFFDSLDTINISLKSACWIAIITAVIATACESVSYKGSDNLTVPLGAAFTIHYMIVHPAQIDSFSLGVILAFLIAALSYYLKFLEGSGSVATFLLGVVVFGIGGWKFALPILAFFILSSIISKLGKQRKQALAEKFQKSSRRDVWQVLANGGIAGVAVLCWNYFPNEWWYYIFVGAVAAANADTWGTEIGVFSKINPRSIINFKPVAVGSSGGITPLGTFGALLGSAVIAGVAAVYIKNAAITFIILISGFIGSVVDSYLGATIQAQYRCPNCRKITEKTQHCHDFKTELVSGWAWIDNDVVNGICTLMGAIFVWLFMKLGF